MEGIIKEEEKNNQQPQEKIEEKGDQNDENNEIKKDEKQEGEKKEEEKKEEGEKEEKHEEKKIEEKHDEEKKEEKQEKEKVNQEKNGLENNSKKDKKKEEIFIYFIGNHDENIPSVFELDKSEFASKLEVLSEDIFPVNNMNYKYSIYRFKISNFKPEDKKNTKIKLKYKINNKSYESKIDIKDFDFDNDIFLYDINFKSDPPHYYKFGDQDTFKIYIKYLRDKKLNQKSEENTNLILSTLKFIICQKKYEFSFYFNIFMKCFANPVSVKLIIEFDFNKITGPGTIKKEKVEKFNILNTYIKKINEKLSLIEDENDKMKFKPNFYTILLYFNYFFKKEEFMLIVNDEQKRDDIYPILLKYNIFKNIELSKEQIGKLINLSSNFNELLIALSFNKDIMIFLQLIEENFDKISDLFKKESSETKKKTKKRNTN